MYYIYSHSYLIYVPWNLYPTSFASQISQEPSHPFGECHGLWTDPAGVGCDRFSYA